MINYGYYLIYNISLIVRSALKVNFKLYPFMSILEKSGMAMCLL